MATRRPSTLTRKILFATHLQKPIIAAVRFKSVTGNKTADEILLKATGGRITRWWDYFNNVTGLSEVKRAQDFVIEAEAIFQTKQENRRNETRELSKLQTHLHQVTKERELAQRGTELYLQLVTKENNIIKNENELKGQIRVLEEEERDAFSKMSSALRASQEIERSHARQSGQISLLLSLAGVMVGGLISMILNHNRMKKMEAIVSSSSKTVGEYQTATSTLKEHVQNQEEKMSELINLHHKAFGDKTKPKEQPDTLPHHSNKHSDMEICIKEVLQIVKNQELVLDKEISDMKALLGAERARELGDSVVYVGPEVKTMLNDTQQIIEWKIKMSALASSVFVYGGVVLTLPILYFLFKGTGSG